MDVEIALGDNNIRRHVCRATATYLLQLAFESLPSRKDLPPVRPEVAKVVCFHKETKSISASEMP